MADERSPGRFRRRLAVTLILVVALSAGLVAAVTSLVAAQSRLRNFRTEAVAEARFTAAVAPADLDDESFDRLRLGYESRSDANLVAISDSGLYSSARNLDTADIPQALRDPPLETGTLRTIEATVNGRPTLVVAARSPGGDEYFSFFSMTQLRDSRAEQARIAVAVWVLVVLGASAIAWWLSRRILRPVADVASTAEAIAAGDLGARLPDSVGDELGTLSVSFNHMADEVERVVDRLEAAAARERRFTADVAHELRTPAHRACRRRPRSSASSSPTSPTACAVRPASSSATSPGCAIWCSSCSSWPVSTPARRRRASSRCASGPPSRSVVRSDGEGRRVRPRRLRRHRRARRPHPAAADPLQPRHERRPSRTRRRSASPPCSTATTCCCT